MNNAFRHSEPPRAPDGSSGLGRRLGVWLVPALLGSVVAAALIVGTGVVSERRAQALKGNMAVTAEQVAGRLEQYLADRLGMVSLLARRWSAFGTPSEAELQVASAPLHRILTGLQAVNWIDENGVIRIVTPFAPNRRALGVDLSRSEIAGPALHSAAETGAPRATPPLQLLQGGRGVATYFPVVHRGELIGYMNGVLRLHPLMREALSPSLRDGFRLAITDEGALVWGEPKLNQTAKLTVGVPIRVLNRTWMLTLAPTHAHAADIQREQDRNILLIALSAALGLLVAVLLRHAMLRRAELIESETRFRNLAANLPGMVLQRRLLPDGRIVYPYIAGAAEHMTGLSPDSLRKSPERLEQAMPPEDRARLHDALRESARRLEPIAFEYHIDRPRAGRVWVRSLGRPRRLADNSTLWDTVEIDITELKDKATALRQARDSAEIANHAKSAFLATMSHELRTPLNAIIGFAEVMRDEMLGPIGNDRYKGYVRDIHDSGSHLLAIISDILDMAKIEAGKQELAEEDVSVSSVVEGAARLVRDRAVQGGLTLKVALDDDLPLLHVDARLFKQILVNLLGNAVKFTPPGGTVTVTASIGEDGGVRLSVRDTGIGIAPENIERLMQPFEQADHDLDRSYEGTGLGLPIAKALTELHDGHIELESKLGEGTTVSVVFPSSRSLAAPRS